MLNQALTAILVAFAPVLLSLLALGLSRLADYVQARARGKVFDHAVALVNQAVYTVVMDLAQTEVEALKAASADGKLDANDAKAIKEKAVARVLSYVGPNGAALISKAFGGAAPMAIVSTKIEALLAERKGRPL